MYSGTSIERLHASFCHGNGGHFGAQLTRFSLCTKMTAVAVAKLLLCCDIICKCSIKAGMKFWPLWRGDHISHLGHTEVCYEVT